MTHESVVQIDAAIGSHGTTRIAKTLVQLGFALQPNETWSTLANESFQLIHAGPSVLTRIRGAVVDGVLTLFARVPWLAGAGVPVDLVYALAVVPARFGGALVDVRFAG